MYLLARHADLTVNGQSAGILRVLVFGAGTEYALLLIARYREELNRHEDLHEAMSVAVRSCPGQRPLRTFPCVPGNVSRIPGNAGRRRADGDVLIFPTPGWHALARVCRSSRPRSPPRPGWTVVS